jgi:hypothetical protein
MQGAPSLADSLPRHFTLLTQESRMTDVAFKDPCLAATTGNITLSGLQTIDGVPVAVGSRVLVKNQTSPANNGIYTAASGAWTRSTTFDGAGEVVGGTMVLVTSGTVNGATTWRVDGTGAITIGSSPINFVLVIQSGAVTVRDKGAAADGVTDARAAFVTCDGVGPFEVSRGLYLISSNLTITNRVTIRPGARLVIPTGVVVTFSGGIEAGDYQIFNLAGTGNAAGLPRANAAWFVGDLIGTTTDMTDLLNKIDGACALNARVDFPKGDYTTLGTTAISFTKGQKVFGAGVNATRILWSSTATNGFSFTGNEFATLSDMTMRVASDATIPVDGVGVYFGPGANNSGARNMKIQRAYNAVKHENTGGGGFLIDTVLSDSLNTGHWIKNTDGVTDSGVIASAFSTLVVVSSTAGFIPQESISWPGGVNHDGNWGYTLSPTLCAIFINIVAPSVGQTITGATSGATCTVTQVYHPHANGALRLEDRCESYISQQSSWAGGVFGLVTLAATPAKGYQPFECHFIDNFFDHTIFGMDIKQCRMFRFTNGWTSAIQGNGWQVGDCDSIEFDGFSTMNCWYSGALIKQGAKNIKIRGGYNRGANISGAGQPAIYIQSNVNRVRISEVNFDDGLVYGSTPNGALFVEPGTSDYIEFTFNDTYGRAIRASGVTGSHNDFATGNG